MIKRITLKIALASLSFLVLGCDLINNKAEKNEGFVKIYDNKGFSESFIPIDIKQLSDESYYVLAKTRLTSSDFYGVYIMHADKDGKFISDQVLDATFVNPIGELLQIDNSLYFFCMNTTTLQAKLMKIDSAGTAVQVAETGIVYPLAAALDATQSNFLLLSYDRDNLQTVVTQITTSGAVSAFSAFSIGTGDFNVEESVVNHLTGTGKQLPFLVGQTGSGKTYFNGYYNFTLSLVFFDMGSSTAGGVIQGYRDERYVSSLLPLTGSTFALSRSAYGNHYILPTKSLNISGISSSGDLTGNSILELASDTRIVVKNVLISGKNIVLYAADTKNSQLVLYAYDEASGNLLGSKHLGYSNPYVTGGFTLTQDNGLAVVSTTYVAGRFPRVCIIKLSVKDLKTLIGKKAE